jgi:hypothetical protein
MSVCPSICPHGTTRLPLDGISWNLISEYFPKIGREISGFINLTIRIGTLLEEVRKFMIMFGSIILRMRSVSDKKIVLKNAFFSFFENRAVYEIMWKNMAWTCHK